MSFANVKDLKTRENLQQLFLFDDDLHPTVLIPKKIHLMWLDKKNDEGTYPKQYESQVESWTKWNPNYIIRVWSLKDLKQLFQDHWKELGRFHDLVFQKINWKTSFIQVCDVARLLVLYIEGGCYFDLDIECLRSLDDLIHDRSVIMFEDNWGNQRFLIDVVTNSSFDMIDNCALGFACRLPFVYELLTFIQHRYEPSSISSSFLETFQLTGPGAYASFAKHHYIYGDYQTLPMIYVDICLTNKYNVCKFQTPDFNPFVCVKNTQSTFWYLSPSSIGSTSMSLLKAWHVKLMILFLFLVILFICLYVAFKRKYKVCEIQKQDCRILSLSRIKTSAIKR